MLFDTLQNSFEKDHGVNKSTLSCCILQLHTFTCDQYAHHVVMDAFLNANNSYIGVYKLSCVQHAQNLDNCLYSFAIHFDFFLL